MSLDKSIHVSLQCIREAIDIYGAESMAISFNGGKDSTVLLDLIGRNFPQITWPAIYVSLPDTFQEMELFVQECEQRYPIRLFRYEDSSLKDGIGAFLRDNKEIKAILVGCRQSDPGCMHLLPIQHSDNNWPPMMRVMPLLEWGYHEIWEYISKYSLPYCSLYNQGYTSIGSISTTKPNPCLQSAGNSASLLEDPSMERSGRT